MAGKPVAVVMGSDSDLKCMKNTIDILNWFGLKYDVHVISAHRTPGRAHEFASTAEKKGYKVIIAGAGGAAHLAGVIASLTTLQIIGVPMQTSALGGVDSLYSTVQMPSGIPVATVAIGDAGATNAGILAAQILALSDPKLARKVKEYKSKLAAKVAAKDANVKKQLKKK